MEQGENVLSMQQHHAEFCIPLSSLSLSHLLSKQKSPKMFQVCLIVKVFQPFDHFGCPFLHQFCFIFPLCVSEVEETGLTTK